MADFLEEYGISAVQLKNFIEDRTNIHRLEKELNIANGTIRRLFVGKKKSFSKNILSLIASYFNLSISQLIDQAKNYDDKASKTAKTRNLPLSPISLAIIHHINKEIENFYTTQACKLSIAEYLKAVFDIYQFSTQCNNQKVSPEFVQWVLSNPKTPFFMD